MGQLDLEQRLGRGALMLWRLQMMMMATTISMTVQA